MADATFDQLIVNNNVVVNNNVGIGTTTPNAQLHIDADVGDGKVLVESGGNLFKLVVDGAGAAIGTVNATPLTLQTDGSARLTINPIGNVGIDKPNPSFKLDVNGVVNATGFNKSGVPWKLQTGDLADNAVTSAKIADGTISATKLVPGTIPASSQWVTGGAGAIAYTGGNVGIGTASPGAKLDITANAFTAGGWYEALRFSQSEHSAITHPGGGLLFGLHGNRSFYFADIKDGTFQKYVMQIEAPSGNVSIGAGSLSVKGDIQFGSTISTPGRMHINGGELLYLLHKNGVVIGQEWGGNGNLTVQGNIGVNGQSPTPRTPGWGGGIHTWDLEAEGTVWSRQGYQTGNRDLAENCTSDLALEAGDIVSLDPDQDRIVLSEKPNDVAVLGVISTAPGMLLNVDPTRIQTQDFPVALCGRVPCKVTDENGAIKRGDLLTTSSTPGYAMKATPIAIAGQELFRPGTLIGKALESHESGQGVIDIFVLPG